GEPMPPIMMTDPEPWRQAVVAWYAGGSSPVGFDVFPALAALRL
ncbi:hypothetical protein LCGC14_2970070, partial [marine sediment metagenome]